MSKINIGAGAGWLTAPGVFPERRAIGEQAIFTNSVQPVAPRREDTGMSPGQERCRPFFLRLARSQVGLVKAVECCRNEVLASLPDDSDRPFQFWFMEGKDGNGWFVVGRRVGLPEVTVRIPWEKIEDARRV